MTRSVADRYDLRELRAESSTGTSWRGYDRVMERAVDVRRLTPPEQLTPEQREATAAAQARAAQRLRGTFAPGLVPVYDVVADGGEVLVVTDAIDGVPLNDLLRREGALPAERVLRIGVRLATTLAALHDAGYVHGDLRPSRVLLDGDEAWILAYGLAREGDGAPTLLASPAYLSPQVLRGAAPTAADDVWSLGVLLTTMLQGTPPFAGRTAPEVLAATGDAATPAVDGWPAPLGGVVGAMLARDPAERPPASRVRRQLETPPAAASQRPATRGERRGDGRSRGVALPLLAVAVVVVIVALIVSRL